MNDENYTVSVIMSTYNEKTEWIKKSIESILYQTFSDFEFIIVIDNPDNVDLIEVLNEYSEKDDRIITIKNSENKGLVYSLNTALSKSRGKYIVRMDADDIAMPYRIEKQLKYLNENNLDLIGAKIQMIDEYGNKNGTVTSKILSNNLLVKDKNIKKMFRTGNCIMHPTWCGKKDVFDKLSGYRDIHACEDYDFLLRAAAAGFKLGNINEELLYYRANFSGISKSNKAKQSCTAHYLSRNSKNINKVTVDDINNFLNSQEGLKYQDKITEYEKNTRILSEYLSNKKYILFLFKLTKLIFTNRCTMMTIHEITLRKYLVFKERSLQ